MMMIPYGTDLTDLETRLSTLKSINAKDDGIPKDLFKYCNTFTDIPTPIVDQKTLFHYFKDTYYNGVSVMSAYSRGCYYLLLDISRYIQKVKLGDVQVGGCIEISNVK
jgi:hypothetical protein